MLLHQVLVLSCISVINTSKLRHTIKVPVVAVTASGGEQHTADKDRENLGTRNGSDAVPQVSSAFVLTGLIGFWKDQAQEDEACEKLA